MRGPKIALGIINFQGEVARGFAGQRDDGNVFSGRLPGELQLPPHFRSVHIHHALRRPNPIIFRCGWYFLASTTIGRHLPFDAGKVNAPLFAFHRRTSMARGLR